MKAGITPRSRSTLVPIIPFSRFSLVSSSRVLFLAAPHWALEKPTKEAANILHSFDLSLSEFVVWWKFLEKLSSITENSMRENAREAITKTRKQIVL